MGTIDGNSWSEITLDGDSIAEVTIDGDVAWTEPSSPTVYENFEAGNLSDYSGSVGEWSVVQSPTPHDGSYVAQPTSSGASIFDIDRQSSPSPGETWTFYMYLTDGTATSHGVFPRFGVQDGDNFYELRCRGGNNTQLYERDADSNSWLAGGLLEYESNAWNRIDVTWDDGTLGGSDGDITVEGYDSSGNAIGSISGNSTTHGDGGLAFSCGLASGEDAYIDYVVSENPSTPNNVNDMSVTFKDTFDQASFGDNTNWAAGWGWGYDSPGDSPSNVNVPSDSEIEDHVEINNSRLILTADRDNWDTDGELHVGAVHSNPSGFDAPADGVTAEPPVYFEARIRTIGGNGWQSAFWSKPENEDWPPEIDVMEMLQDGSTSDWTSHNVHYSSSGDCNDETTHSTYDGQYDSYDSGNAPYETFHTYGFEWREDVMRHYVDGQVVEEITDQTILDALANSGCRPHYMMLSLNLDNVGTTDKTISWDNKQMEVDWVRVYKP